MTLIIIKFIFLFIGIWFSLINIGRLKYEQDIPASSSFLQALGITGFIFLQFFM
jgi:hypothetical protein